ncbi:ABC transporter permease [Allonocardiopsis opalescens]|uniref:ABC-type transport system involved in multi-copper enzyme maturation permease subunit n=1 Tax=Allonocardiopsis opalescens TaxID=1144618 RepID=A0A2T0QFF2_9ACTN|nr:ABC transporter permease [Allonocardiopsis opalescens]PRY02648.1 hypothetical protein CLV72_1011251 [Allonocardiopsis opalescens]
MTLSGIRTMARQEFRVRLRTGRWRTALMVWTSVIGLFSLLLWSALQWLGVTSSIGVTMFSTLMLFVLSLALLVMPATSAQSVNGDRERGTLASVQVTRLTAADIAIGKFAAAWGTGLVALALTTPFAGWAVLEGGVGWLRALAVLAVVALLIGVVCAVSLAASAVFPRTTTSALAAYLAVFALSFGTLIAFLLASALTAETVQRTYGERTVETRVPQTHRVWGWLAPNPYVILADAVPSAIPAGPAGYVLGFEAGRASQYAVVGPVIDPMEWIRNGVRGLRVPPADDYGAYGEYTPYGDAVAIDPRTGEAEDGGPVWPYGLAFNVALGAGALWITVRRLRTPMEEPPGGTRIA